MNWEDFYKEIQETYHIEDEATVIKVPFDDVKEITSEALFYKKGYLDTKKSVLNDCARNFYLAQGISPDENNGGLKCVGGRCFPFFEFFTPEHHTRIYIPLKKTVFTRFLQKIRLNPYAKERSEFYAFQKKLNDAGFTTLDLT
ncbi:MAG: hypothetical protein IJY39_06900 [Clostridia bacterium]|nr:hypothetical protein [Clostridia bacterium]